LARFIFMKNNTPDFLVTGHICYDKIPGGYLPGGAAAYAGLLAARLGYHSAALTSFGPDFLFASQFADLRIEAVPSPVTTVFENIYHDGERIQFLHQKAIDLTPVHLPQHWRQAKTVLLGPICDEVSFDFLDAFDEKTIVCACPQGWMRQWDETHRVSPKPIENWELLAKADIISMSENDVAGDWNLIEKIAGMVNLLLVTQGSLGATVFHQNRREHFPSYPAAEVDPTGAGDIFAAAFTLHFSQEKNVAQAVAFAHAAASLSVEGKGMAAIPGKAAVEERYRSYCKMEEIGTLEM
jgi:1D-myo-inositol 3-kinase